VVLDGPSLPERIGGSSCRVWVRRRR